MLAHVLLFLVLVFSGFALVTLLLLRQAVADHGVAPRPVLVKASRWAGLVFLMAALAIAVGGGPHSVSLMASGGLAPAWTEDSFGDPADGVFSEGQALKQPSSQSEGGRLDFPSGDESTGSASDQAAVILSAEVRPALGGPALPGLLPPPGAAPEAP